MNIEYSTHHAAYAMRNYLEALTIDYNIIDYLSKILGIHPDSIILSLKNAKIRTAKVKPYYTSSREDYCAYFTINGKFAKLFCKLTIYSSDGKIVLSSYIDNVKKAPIKLKCMLLPYVRFTTYDNDIKDIYEQIRKEVTDTNYARFISYVNYLKENALSAVKFFDEYKNL